MNKMKNIQVGLVILTTVLFANCSKSGSTPQPPAATQPRVSINDIIKPEGNGGTTAFVFDVTLDKPSSQSISVNYSVRDASALVNEDYTHNVQTLTFAANETQKTITVNVVADDRKETDEEFTVMLMNALNAVIYKAEGRAVIQNDDTRIAFTNAGYEAPTSYAGYSLSWADEFNGSSLNTSIWAHENGDGCPGNCGWGNNELEYYTDRADNLFFQDGKLIIEAKKENFSGKTYTSSKILTRDKKPIKFGRIDIRAKLPKGKGIWPAFWMMPQASVFGGWPRSGELDIMEVVGHEPHKTHGTLHFGPGPGSTQLGGSYSLPSGTFYDEFHVFSIEWKQDQIKWLVDGVVFSTHTKSEFGANNYPFNEEFYLIFNLAVGGNWPGSPDASTTFPQWLIVDYVRVYQ